MRWSEDFPSIPVAPQTRHRDREQRQAAIQTADLAPARSKSHDRNGNVIPPPNGPSEPNSAHYEYGPFGEVLRATGPMAAANPFRFSTKFQDDETGLLHYGYRYYNPSTGRWNSRDPADEDDQENLYGFVFNAPISSADMLGLYTFKVEPAIDVDVAQFAGAMRSATVAVYGSVKPLQVTESCPCKVLQPEMFSLSVRIYLGKTGTSRGGVWVASSSHDAFKSHEKKHVKIWEHYGKIFEQFERWQKRQKEKGPGCQQKLLERIARCRAKVFDFFDRNAAAHDSLDAAEHSAVKTGWIPAQWVGGPWYKQVEAQIYFVEGKWKKQLDPVKLDCE